MNISLINKKTTDMEDFLRVVELLKEVLSAKKNEQPTLLDAKIANLKASISAEKKHLYEVTCEVLLACKEGRIAEREKDKWIGFIMEDPNAVNLLFNDDYFPPHYNNKKERKIQLCH